MQPEAIELLAFSAAALAFAVAIASARARRRTLVMRGTVGLAGVAGVALVPTFDLVLLIALALAVLQASAPAERSLAARLRAPGAAVAIIALALAFARIEGPQVLERLAAVGLVAGLCTAVGLLPFMPEFNPDEDVSTSPISWLAFIGPAFAVALALRVQSELSVDAGGIFGAMLIGLGLLNVAWGNMGAWLTADANAAWRYSFMSDWGLALVGFGLALGDARAAALLILFALMLGRLPLYLMFRAAPAAPQTAERPINLVLAALLAGSAPFAGFAARLLLLRAATELFWPLALALGLGMLLWLPGSLRLGRSMRVGGGQRALVAAVIIALNVAVGIYPLPILSAGGH